MLYTIIALIICGFMIYMGNKELNQMDSKPTNNTVGLNGIGNELMSKLSMVEKEIKELKKQKEMLANTIQENEIRLSEIRKEIKLAEKQGAFS